MMPFLSPAVICFWLLKENQQIKKKFTLRQPDFSQNLGQGFSLSIDHNWSTNGSERHEIWADIQSQNTAA